MFLTLLSTLLLATPALADDRGCDAADDVRGPHGRGPHEGGPPDGRPPGPPPHDVLLDELDSLGLSDATRSAVRAAVESARPELEALEDDAFAGDRDARAALHQRGRALMDEVRGLLTDEEWERVREALPPPPGRHGRGPDDG